MFAFLSRFVRTVKPAIEVRQSCKPGVECLENRLLPHIGPLPTTWIMLDFTPDHRSGSLADTFSHSSIRTAAGFRPTFLDFNKDGFVNSADVPLAAREIANKTASYFAQVSNGYGYAVNIRYHDFVSDTKWGKAWIDKGLKSDEHVAVMYFGGVNKNDSSTIGIAPLAGANQNIEGFGETYTRQIALNLLKRPGATTGDFVDMVASTAAHELGHMFGLKHTTSTSPNNLMAAQATTANSGSGKFLANATQELRDSFAGGQLSVAGDVRNAGKARELDCSHEVHDNHADHHEDDHFEFADDVLLTDSGTDRVAPGSTVVADLPVSAADPLWGRQDVFLTTTVAAVNALALVDALPTSSVDEAIDQLLESRGHGSEPIADASDPFQSAALFGAEQI